MDMSSLGLEQMTEAINRRILVYKVSLCSRSRMATYNGASSSAFKGASCASEKPAVSRAFTFTLTSTSISRVTYPTTSALPSNRSCKTILCAPPPLKESSLTHRQNLEETLAEIELARRSAHDLAAAKERLTAQLAALGLNLQDEDVTRCLSSTCSPVVSSVSHHCTRNHRLHAPQRRTRRLPPIG